MGLGSEIRDTESEIRDPEKTYRYSGSRIPDPGVIKSPDSGSATLLAALIVIVNVLFPRCRMSVHQLSPGGEHTSEEEDRYLRVCFTLFYFMK
jgi:hypothetical protein